MLENLMGTDRRAVGDTPAIHWEDFEADYHTIPNRISRVVPDFEDFNARVRKPGWIPAAQRR
ncbi:MAG TPA: hypothetical protein VMC78_03420 [Mycobacterium sp.]|nr:hypothetical protein [Mycobacterium sp.]